jgi:glycosyltransferase involved in cell wall biosynthesis
MKITQAVFGVFHHFDLARELEARGHLQAIYSTFPWARLKREGIPREKVKTFPWLHTPEFMLDRAGLLPLWAKDEIGYKNALWFDEYTLGKVDDCDAFIALAGAGLKTGRRLQARGGKFLCDRGSTHTRYQERVVSEEQRRWQVEVPVTDIRDTLREEEIYACCDAITVPSSFARRSFVELGLPAEKVHVIPYGVRLERFGPVATPPEDRFEVLFVGSVTTRKGFPYVLQAFERLRHPAKRLRVVGGVPDWMKPVIGRLPTEHVEFLGILPQAELPGVMSSSHVMMLPSVEEGLALVQGQALACGCPVLATPNTGSEDLFSDEVEGFIVAERDVHAMAERLERLAGDRELQERMRQAALDRVKHLGGWSAYGDAWEMLLQKLTRSD